PFLRYLSGKETKDHFQRITEGEVAVSMKPQAVYRIPETWKKETATLLKRMDEGGRLSEVVKALNLEGAMKKKVPDLSGGELQRVAVAAAALREADLYLFRSEERRVGKECRCWREPEH